MSRSTYLVIGSVLIVFLLMLLRSRNPVKGDEGKDGNMTKNFAKEQEIFSSVCSGCHGERVEAFADRKWKHGTQKDSIIYSIKHGYADAGMPSFAGAFDDRQIERLAEYISRGIENVRQFDFDSIQNLSNHFHTNQIDIRLDTIASGINHPWAIAFLPGGDLLFTERSGKLFRVKERTLYEVRGVPKVFAEGQGGLLDVVLHPDFLTNRLLYLSYSSPRKTDSGIVSTTAVMRAKFEDDSLIGKKDVFVALPFSKTKHHFGSRLLFGPDGLLYITVGERGNHRDNPQNLRNALGKIHRIKDDGTIPDDNPFIRIDSALKSIYSYGHRNPQGMTIDPSGTGIWTNEHGPRGGDELNFIVRGKNYGWPIISYGINYDGKPITNLTAREGMEQPNAFWVPSIAPSGIAFVGGSKYANWTGDALIGSLRFKYLNRCKIRNGKIVEQEPLLKNIGRVRDVRMAPDGYVYIAVESPGYIFRLFPIDKKNKSK